MTDRSYEYRFVAACGLQFRYIGEPEAQAHRPWVPVRADDLFSMTWEELEHVAHVIRDASKPKAEGEAV